MKAEDKHRWGIRITEVFGFSKQVCIDCGCVKMHVYGQLFYSRSGRFFPYRPDCIKDEIENAKTID